MLRHRCADPFYVELRDCKASLPFGSGDLHCLSRLRMACEPSIVWPCHCTARHTVPGLPGCRNESTSSAAMAYPVTASRP